MGRRLLAIAGIAVAVAILLSWAWAAGVFQVRIPTTGKIVAVNVGVYRDSACTVNLTQIDWGLIGPSENETVVCYVKSLSTVPAALSLSTANWNVSQAYFSVAWDREGVVLAPEEVVSAALTLHVDSAIQGVESFSFDIIVSGSG